MGTFLQMGHNTQNLVGERDLDNFTGIVLSPLNRIPTELKNDIIEFRKIKDYNIVLDPQLYYPNTSKDKIKLHPYFPNDFESSDNASISWWQSINRKLLNYGKDLNVNTISSPIIDPRKYDFGYYKLMIDVSNHLKSIMENGITTWASVIIEINAICDEVFLMQLASIISLSEADGFYIVFKSDLEPRREFNDEQQLGAMLKIITELRILNKEIMVSFSGSDMLLYKLAGATHCGTGNFFNLRRFTKSRYEDLSGGGGQLGYLFEHNLMAFLRESDIQRILQRSLPEVLLGQFSNNYWADVIFRDFKEKPGVPWVAHGWRQYLSWFSKTEKTLNEPDSTTVISNWLKKAEENWLMLEDHNILMEEQRNNGKWLRPWRQAISKV